jgi:hypothetical protein
MWWRWRPPWWGMLRGAVRCRRPAWCKRRVQDAASTAEGAESLFFAFSSVGVHARELPHSLPWDHDLEVIAQRPPIPPPGVRAQELARGLVLDTSLDTLLLPRRVPLLRPQSRSTGSCKLRVFIRLRQLNAQLLLASALKWHSSRIAVSACSSLLALF